MGFIFALSVLGLSLSPPLLHVQQRGAALSRAHAGAIAMQTLPADPAYVTTASGLKYLDEKVGSGEEAAKGAMIKVDYTGTLASDGSQFDSSKGRAPITFELGAGRVIPGLDEGISGMRVGGKRKLLIPSSLAYGEAGAGANIPPNSDLVFETELVGIATGMDSVVAKIPGGMPNLILGSLLAVSFIPYFLPMEIRSMLPGYTAGN